MRHLIALGVIAACVSPAAAQLDENIKKLSSKNALERREAAQALGEAGPTATKAIKPLTRALSDKDRFVRKFAALALGNIGPAAREAVPALTKLLEDDRTVRPAALQALAKMGPSAVPALAKAAGKGNAEDVQDAAIDALGKAGKEGLGALLDVIKDKDVPGTMRRKALGIVQTKGRDAAARAIPVVADVIKDPRTRDRQLRQESVAALGAMARPSDAAAVKVLNDIVNDAKSRDMGLKNQARRALAQIMKRK